MDEEQERYRLIKITDKFLDLLYKEKLRYLTELREMEKRHVRVGESVIHSQV